MERMGFDGMCCGLPADRAALRRRRIIEAARTLFVANGFHATGVAQIARASGVAVGQLYRDFAAKEDIVAEIVTGDCETFMARAALAEAIEGRDEAAVWAWLRDFIEPAEDAEADPLFAEIVAESARNARIAAIFARKRDDVTGCMLDALTLLAPGDALAERRSLLAELILTQSLGMTQHRLLDPMLDARRLTDTLMGVIKREIAAMRGECRPMSQGPCLQAMAEPVRTDRRTSGARDEHGSRHVTGERHVRTARAAAVDHAE